MPLVMVQVKFPNPAGAVTVPLPVLPPEIVSVTFCSANDAVTLFAAVITTTHGDVVPLHAPLQPLNVLLLGVALIDTDVPDG
jgi:hypothetical protein